jgi:NADH-quinone oxidoreductase subunit M
MARVRRRIPVKLICILGILSGISAMLPAHYLPVGMLTVPLMGVGVGLLLPMRMRGKTWGLAVSGSTMMTAVSMALQYDWVVGGYQFNVDGPRISMIGASFSLGVDQVSLILVLLTAVLHPLAVAASLWSVHTRSREHYANMNLLLVFMLGTFMAKDLLLFYTFFEASLVPLFFIVGVWGGKARRKAAVTLFLYTFTGSVFMLAGVVYLGSAAHTYDLGEVVRYAQTHMSERERFWLLLSFLAAFGVKTPLFPLHTWLPLAHTEAPTAGSVDLAAMVLKLGTYGLLRIALPIGMITADGRVLFPAVLHFLGVLCLIGIVYAALVAWVQTDIKKLVAYSSVSHLGFCVLGMLSMTAHGMAGAVLYMVNHGIVSGGLFLAVGMIYHRYHTRDIRELSGLARAMPRLAFFLMLFTFASVGLPGLNGFVSELLTTLGAFTSEYLGVTYGVIAATGIFLGAIYMLHFAGSILYGPLEYPLLQKELDTHVTVHPRYVPGGDISKSEVLVLLPLGVLIVALGVFPTPFLKAIERPLADIRHASVVHESPKDELRAMVEAGEMQDGARGATGNRGAKGKGTAGKSGR